MIISLLIGVWGDTSVYQPSGGTGHTCSTPKKKDKVNFTSLSVRSYSNLFQSRPWSPWNASGMSRETLARLNNYWLVVWTPLKKYESQLGWWNSQYMGTYLKWQPNHQPDYHVIAIIYSEASRSGNTWPGMMDFISAEQENTRCLLGKKFSSHMFHNFDRKHWVILAVMWLKQS